MSIEIVMLDMEDGSSALNILLHCIAVMPDGFFSRAAMCTPRNDIKLPDFVDHIQCSFQSGNMFGYNVWSVREFPRYIVCDHCLTIHRDGFILNPEKWSEDFLLYDYIGAPWNAHANGGNGGFYLQTKEFGKWVSKHPFPIDDGIPADVYMCQTLEWTAKSAGFKYAPCSVAAKFSLELPVPEYPRTLRDVFGFHGKFHLQQNPPLTRF